MRYLGVKAILCAALLLLVSWPAGAADSLLSTFGHSFTFYHVYNKPDGTTAVEQLSVPVDHTGKSGVSGVASLFAGPADAVVRWKPGNVPSTPFHSASRTELVVVLQGDVVITVSGGKEQRIKAGQVVLDEDYRGAGHSGRCEAVNRDMGCVQVFLYPKDNTFLRKIKRSGAGFCAANCTFSKRDASKTRVSTQ